MIALFCFGGIAALTLGWYTTDLYRAWKVWNEHDKDGGRS